MVTAEVSSPQGLTVLYEDPTADAGFVQATDTSARRVPPVDLTVTGPSGDPIATAPYGTDLRFDVGLVANAVGDVVLFVGTWVIALPMFAVVWFRRPAGHAPHRPLRHA